MEHEDITGKVRAAMRKEVLLLTIPVLTMMRVDESMGQVVVRDSVVVSPSRLGDLLNRMNGKPTIHLMNKNSKASSRIHTGGDGTYCYTYDPGDGFDYFVCISTVSETMTISCPWGQVVSWPLAIVELGQARRFIATLIDACPGWDCYLYFVCFAEDWFFKSPTDYFYYNDVYTSDLYPGTMVGFYVCDGSGCVHGVDFTINQQDINKYRIDWENGVIVLVELEEEELDHFLINTEPDTINHFENATITVQAKDENGNNVDPPEGTLLNFSLDANGALYGSLLAPDGSTAESLTGITYGDARACNVKYIADGEEPDSTAQVVITVVKSDDTSKNGSGGVVVRGSKLEILSPSKDTPCCTIWISNTPTMPVDTCKAVLLNYQGGQVTYQWHYRVKYILPRGRAGQNLTRQDSLTFDYVTVANNSDTTTCVVDFVIEEDTTFIGGNVTVFVDAVTPNKTYRDIVSNQVVILGENPTPQQARADVGTELDVIMYMESRFLQYYNAGRINCDRRNTLHYPLFGPPDGRGICQIEFSYRGNDLYEADDMKSLLWNWRSNRTQGLDIFNDKRNYGLEYPERIRDRARRGELTPGYLNVTDFTTQEQILKEAFQLYNGGHQWRWYPDDPGDPDSDGQWLPRPGRSGYGDEAWQIYINVNNGNPPQNWN